MSFNTRTEEYYKKFIELQEKLRKSEEERLKLEMKFNEMLRVTREEEQLHYRKLRSQYKRFIEEDRRRQDRNERILRTLERIETRVAMLIAKTERFKLLRQQYQTFLDRIYKANQIKKAEGVSNTPKEKQSEKAQPPVESSDIVQSYIQNLSSQKLKDLLRKEEDARKRLPFSVETTPEETVRNPDEYSIFGDGESRPIYANSIADDIMSSIYSRHNPLKDDSRQLQPRELNNNFNSTDFRIPQKMLGDFSGFKRTPPADICRESNITQQTEDSETDDSPESQISSKAGSMQFNDKSTRAFLSEAHKMQENPHYQNVDDNIPRKETEYSRYKEVNNDGKNPVLQEIPKHSNSNGKIPHVQEVEPQKYQNKSFVANKPNSETGAPFKEDVSNSNVQNINRSVSQRSNLKDGSNEVIPQQHIEIISEPTSQDVELANQPQVVREIVSIPSDNVNQKTLISQQPVKDVQPRKLEEVEIPTNIDEQKEKIIDEESKRFEPPLADEVDDSSVKEHVEHRQPEEECVSIEQHLQTSYENVQVSKDGQPIRNDFVEDIPHQQQTQQYDDEKQQAVEPQEYHDNDRELTYDESRKSVQQHNADSVPVVYDQQEQPSYEENDQIIQQYDEQGHPLQLQEFNEDDQFQHYDQNSQPFQQFDENGEPLQVSQYDGGQYLQQYDENGQPIQYDESGQFIQQYDENGQPLQQYDANGQPLQQYDDNSQPFAQYDENGQFIGQYNENSKMFEQYDEHNQLIQQYDQSGQIMQQYDDSGQLIQQYDENAHLQQYQYDENGQIIQQYDLNDGQQYDEHGPVVQPLESTQQFYEQPYEEKAGEDPNQQQYVEEALLEQQVTEEQPKDQNVPTTDIAKASNVMEMLDTDTESAKQDTKISNDSDFDFSNA